jgi:hypothetical protein
MQVLLLLSILFIRQFALLFHFDAGVVDEISSKVHLF